MTHVNKKLKKKNSALSSPKPNRESKKQRKKKKKRKESETTNSKRWDRDCLESQRPIHPPRDVATHAHTVTLARARPILILLPSSQYPRRQDPLAAAAHRYLLLYFPSKPNKYKMFVIWFKNLRFTETVLVPSGLVVFHVCVFTDEWWIELMLVIDWLWIKFVLPVVFFFFFWLYDSVTLCLWLSILYYIDERERERERE